MNGNSQGTMGDYAWSLAQTNKDELKRFEQRIKRLEAFIRERFPTEWVQAMQDKETA